MTAEVVGSFAPRVPPHAERDSKFEAFYQRYHPCVLGYAGRVFGASEADDIAQETMARAYLHFNRLDPHRDPWPWLCVVARHVGTDIMRGHARMVAVEDKRLADVPSDERDAPHERAVAADNHRVLSRALAQLSDTDRHVLRLREYDDLSVADIAALLDRSETAVRQQLFRARRRLAERFKAVAGVASPAVLLPVLFRLRLRRAARSMAHMLQGAGPAATSALIATTSLLAVATNLIVPRDVPVGPGSATTAAVRSTGSRETPVARPPVASVATAVPGETASAAPSKAPAKVSWQPSDQAPVTYYHNTDISGDPLENSNSATVVETPLGDLIVDVWLEEVDDHPICEGEISAC